MTITTGTKDAAQVEAATGNMSTGPITTAGKITSSIVLPQRSDTPRRRSDGPEYFEVRA